MTTSASSPAPSGQLRWPGYLIGFALGGFFDGILLHQILQWHHLLSLVPGVDGITGQILFDGIFHAFMYVMAAVGMVMLARRRASLADPIAGRMLLAGVLLGFGMWHVVDTLASHWVLGIHRIRLDSGDPLFWDVLWLVLFGLFPILAGWLIRRGTGSPRGGGGIAAVGLALALAVGGSWSALPPASARSAVVMFRPDVTDGQAVNAIGRTGGAVLWRSRGVWAVRWPEGVRSAPLYDRGAMIVSTSLFGAGCLAWSEI